MKLGEVFRGGAAEVGLLERTWGGALCSPTSDIHELDTASNSRLQMRGRKGLARWKKDEQVTDQNVSRSFLAGLEVWRSFLTFVSLVYFNSTTSPYP